MTTDDGYPVRAGPTYKQFQEGFRWDRTCDVFYRWSADKCENRPTKPTELSDLGTFNLCQGHRDQLRVNKLGQLTGRFLRSDFRLIVDSSRVDGGLSTGLRWLKT